MRPDDRIPSDHDGLRELCAGHALGSLDPSDADRLLEHLREGCLECEREVESYRRTVVALAGSFDPVPPPPAAEAEFMERIGGGSAVGVLRAHPASRRLRALLPAAAVLIAALSLWVAWDARRQSARLVQENLVLHEAVTAMAEPSVRVLRLRGEDPAVSGWVVIETGAPDATDHDWILVHATLPAEPPGRAYYAWMRIGAEVHAVGRVERDSDGFAIVRGPFGLEGRLAGVVITLEPQVDPESPTGPVILEYREEAPGP